MIKTDEKIQTDVMDELRWEPILHASEIGVSVRNGVVTLTGQVDNYSMKMAAERAAQRVQGVEVMVQEVGVNPLFGTRHTDEEIAQAIMRSFEWHNEIPHANLDAKVEEGWITLTGEVEWNHEREAAAQAVKSFMGVKGVTNEIHVKPRAGAQDVKNKIVNAFRRSAVLEAQQIRVETDVQIRVETDVSKVTLSGKVHTWADRREAAAAAWAASGVTTVEDNLVVAI